MIPWCSSIRRRWVSTEREIPGRPSRISVNVRQPNMQVADDQRRPARRVDLRGAREGAEVAVALHGASLPGRAARASSFFGLDSRSARWDRGAMSTSTPAPWLSRTSTAPSGRPAATPTSPSMSTTSRPHHLLARGRHRARPVRARRRHRHRQRRAARRAVSAPRSPASTSCRPPRHRPLARGRRPTSHWIEGDAEALPFGDATLRPRAVRVRRPVRPAPPGRRRRARARLPPRRHDRARQLDARGPDRPHVQDPRRATCPRRRAVASPPPLWGSEEHERSLFAGLRRVARVRARRQPVRLPERSRST